VTPGPVPVLLYHAVTDQPSAWIGQYTVRPDDFARHLDLLVASGRSAVTLSALWAGLGGHGRLPERPVVVTFDDGFADTAEVAAPLLAERGIVSTVYVTSGFVEGGRSPGGDRMLTWDQVRALAADGHEIGAHSHTHPQLDLLPAALARAEILRSKQLLEDALGGASVPSFAYPHGYQTPRIRAQVAAAGFSSACAVRNAFTAADDHRLALGRLMLTAGTTPAEVEAWLAGTGAPTTPPLDPVRTKAYRAWRRMRRPDQAASTGA
jgi:peptidoglycan/xylan/chitin deacetylase (PgdA/CDA1 family)